MNTSFVLSSLLAYAAHYTTHYPLVLMAAMPLVSLRYMGPHVHELRMAGCVLPALSMLCTVMNLVDARAHHRGAVCSIVLHRSYAA